MNEIFKCQRCGRCCGVVPFTTAEYLRIKEEADLRGIEFVKMGDEDACPNNRRVLV